MWFPACGCVMSDEEHVLIVAKMIDECKIREDRLAVERDYAKRLKHLRDVNTFEIRGETTTEIRACNLIEDVLSRELSNTNARIKALEK